MIDDISTLPLGSKLNADICIVGAGAAGITIAREFLNTSTNVLILEAGGLNFETTSQELYRGDTSGVPIPRQTNYLSISRLRYFGGTTNHWTGWCRPLDPIDFEARTWVPQSGWPFKRAELDPYYLKAAPILDITAPNDSLKVDGSVAEPYNFSRSNSALVTRNFHFSPPTRFSAKYKAALTGSRNIRLLTHANVAEIKVSDMADHVTGLRVLTPNLKEFTVSARVYILASGGVENARLLLLSDQIQRHGLGNRADMVGRFFAEHPQFNVGLLALTKPDASTQIYKRLKNKLLGHATRSIICLSDDQLRRHELLNFSVQLDLLNAAKKFELERARAIGANLQAIDCLTDPNSFGKGPEILSAFLRIEQRPNPASQVTLSRTQDALGLRKAALNWQLTKEDAASYFKGFEILGRELGALGLGRLQFGVTKDAPWKLLRYSGHHMGTTRMHRLAQQGVVDENCKLHGMDNLFVSGSSVFPTYGYANPTFTIVALALRLADYLKAHR